MAKTHTTETLGFNKYGGYYASMPQGYGGFNWSDVDYMNATYWQNVQTNWCDTGYQNVIRGAGEAYTCSTNGTTSFGYFASADPKETFSLKSMIVASAWETGQYFGFRSYTYEAGVGLVPKLSEVAYRIDPAGLGQAAQTINFTKFGNRGYFNNISALSIVSGTGTYGNTCTYGRYGYTKGNEMAFDNLKVIWNGKIPKGNDGRMVTKGLVQPGHAYGGHPAAAHLAAGDAVHRANFGAPSTGTDHPGMLSDFHSELMSLDGPETGGLTTQFHLPVVEHFGS